MRPVRQIDPRDLDPAHVWDTISEARSLESALTEVSLAYLLADNISADAEIAHGVARARELISSHPWILSVLPVGERAIAPPKDWVRQFMRTTDEPGFRRIDPKVQLEHYTEEGKGHLDAYRRETRGTLLRQKSAVVPYVYLTRGITPEELCFESDDELVELVCTASKSLAERTG